MEPIVYYVDRGAPEPVRSALVEGASWWAEAFEAAGFIDGYRVEILPEGVHPLDVRYNVIQWVHRSTRGWSYGGGSRRSPHRRDDQGPRLAGFAAGAPRPAAHRGPGREPTRPAAAAPDDPVELALARIRQLSAHEVGHTLGFTHNFAASTYGGRASVMDYPAPLVEITDDGELDLSRRLRRRGRGLGSPRRALRLRPARARRDRGRASRLDHRRRSPARARLHVR